MTLEEVGMLKRFLKQLFMHNIVIVWSVIAITCAIFGIFVSHQKPSIPFLQNFLFWGVGVWLVGAFFMHWIQPAADRICEGLGWPKGSPFQKEVAAADGAFGILGIICGFTAPTDFWTSTVIGASFMLFTMGVGHVLDIVKTENESPLNAGSTMYYGLLLPVVLVTLLIIWKAGYYGAVYS